MTRRFLAICLFAVSALVGGSGMVSAQTFLEQLVMPGPVAESHAKVEKECSKCHEAFSSHSQPALCLDCHKDIAADREARKGYHGRQPDARDQNCRQCHTDHKGRDADIMQLDRERFDHELTNYSLIGSHRSAPCSGCHAERKPFHKTPTACIECHRKNDAHNGKLGDKCDNCHSPTKWRETKPFDHSKTRFTLEGAHKSVLCETCHAGQIYKDLPRTCVSCHKLQDIHGARYGEKCETCHDQTKWKEAKFDHDKTKFPLRGAHEKGKCDLCHAGDLYRDKLNTACGSCHAKQDPHQARLGEKCETCHNEIDWRKGIRFDHAKSKFPLLGKHQAVTCEGCHRTQLYKDTPIPCEKCHADIMHKGRLGMTAVCQNCHTPENWKKSRYDHARQAHYPLVGSHAKIQCEACHAVAGAPLKLPRACESCHKDRFHEGRLGPKCDACHEPTTWKQWRYDHGVKAHFPLTGAHARIQCEACHNVRNPPNLKLPRDCASCHKRDDAHANGFGPTCERCHVTSTWRQINIR